MSTQEILDQIDEAVSDWDVGPDAMRCGATVSTSDTAGALAVRWSLPEPRSADLIFRLSLDMRPFIEALETAAKALADMSWFNLRLKAKLPKKHRNGPQPLSIDGHAYHRRLRGRTGR